MRKEEFFEVLGELDDDILERAERPMKKKIDRRAFRTAAIAAVLAIALIVPAAAYAVEIVRYNAAVEYLRTLGIDVMDLSDYSREEVIRAVEVYEAGEDGIIEDLVPDRGHTVMPQGPTSVTSEQVERLIPAMTVTDVMEELGGTMDIGSGMYVLIYKVDDIYTLAIPFAGDDAQLGVYGEDLLKALQPIE